MKRRAWMMSGLILMAGATAVRAATQDVEQVSVGEAPALEVPVVEELKEIVITALEPRYVAPTRRDRIGRIWAPVKINDKGPFRMVLDTGASHSAIIEPVADALGIDLATSQQVRLRGVTGTAIVPLVAADKLTVGDLELRNVRMPIVVNALGGAQGVLGTEGFEDKRVLIDFRNDLILINHSNNDRAPNGMITVPFVREKGLLIVSALIGGVPSRAIIDTGGQASIGNVALRNLLQRRRSQAKSSNDTITGATDDSQTGEGYPAPVIELEQIQVQGSHITFGDMSIFEHWGMTTEPAILLGMDTLGLLDTLIIDFRRQELQIRLWTKRRS